MPIHQGNKLKKLIKEKGYTQEEFGTLIGVTRNQVIVYCKEYQLRKDLIEKVSKALEVDASVFFKEEEEIKGMVRKEEFDLVSKENEYLKKINSMLEKEIERLEEEIKKYKRND